MTDRPLFHGDDIGAVVAEDEVAAAQAIRILEKSVEYEELPFVLDAQEAMKDGAPQLHENYPNNILAHTEIHMGNVEEAIKEKGLNYQFGTNDAEPLIAGVVVALAHGHRLIVGEVVAQCRRHHHRVRATALGRILHVNRHAKLGGKRCHSVGLIAGVLHIIIGGQHAVPVIGGIAEVGRDTLPVDSDGLRACAALGILVIAHNLGNSCGHTAHIVVRSTISGAHRVVGLALPPQDTTGVPWLTTRC